MASLRPAFSRSLCCHTISPSTCQLAARAPYPQRRKVACLAVRADASKLPSGHGGHQPNTNAWLRNSKGFFLRAIVPRGLLIGAAMSLASMQVFPHRSEASTSNVNRSTGSDSAPTVHEDLPSVGAKSETASPVKSSSPLVMVAGGFIIPHPAKADKGGEDAYYIAKTGRSFGVADGVGGWADVGIDPGEFSRMLMRECRKAAESDIDPDGGEHVPARILDAAFQRSRHITGSSTACIVCLQDHKLYAANLGDSGFMIVRDGKLIFETPPQQHSFNFPFQIGSYGDAVSTCQEFTVDVQPGDVIVAGSDGLLDNVFNQRSARVVWDAKKRGSTPGVAAQQLATFAAARAKDPVYLSPFAKAARENGYYYQGGKVDDITVIVAYVTTPGEIITTQPASKL